MSSSLHLTVIVVIYRVPGPLLSPSSKNKEIYSKKISYISLKKQFFLYFGKWNFPSSKNKKSTLRKFLIFSQKKAFLRFREMELFLKNFLYFRRELSELEKLKKNTPK